MSKEEIGMRDEIIRMQKKTKIGDCFKVKTLKGWDPTVNTTTTRSTIEKKAEVVGKSARFAILKYENGITEAFLWSDLIGFKKNSSMKKKS